MRANAIFIDENSQKFNPNTFFLVQMNLNLFDLTTFSNLSFHSNSNEIKLWKNMLVYSSFFPALIEGSRCMGACAYCASQCWCAVSAPVFSTSRSDNAHARFDARGRCQWIVSGISLMFSRFGPACSFNLTQFLYSFCWNFSKFKITAVKVYVCLSFHENCRALMYKI